MKQIIEDVLKAENDIHSLLHQARQQAAEIKHAVDKECAELLNEAKSKAQAMAQKTLEDARRDAEKLKEERLRQAEQEKKAFFAQNSSSITRLVDSIYQLLQSTESDQG